MACDICGLTKSCHCNESERIIHAAIKATDGRIFFGKCHADCFHKAHAMGVKVSTKASDQGFVSNKGNYFNRQEAAKIAFEQGQIDRPTSLLFSEDLWHDEYSGKYHHDEINGYVKREGRRKE